MLSHCREISITQNFHPKQWCLIRDIFEIQSFWKKESSSQSNCFLATNVVAIADGHTHQS